MAADENHRSLACGLCGAFRSERRAGGVKRHIQMTIAIRGSGRNLTAEQLPVNGAAIPLK
jgi:hypothetical protein